MKRGYKIVAKEYSWTNGDSITLRKDGKGDTFIGVIGHNIMHLMNRNKIEIYEERIKFMKYFMKNFKGGTVCLSIFDKTI